MKIENLVVIIRAMAAYWNWDILHDRVERPIFGPLNIEMTDLTTGGDNLEGFVGPHYLQDDHYWGRFNEIMDDWSPYDYDYDYEIWQNATKAGKHCYIKTDVYYFHLRDELVCE